MLSKFVIFALFNAVVAMEKDLSSVTTVASSEEAQMDQEIHDLEKDAVEDKKDLEMEAADDSDKKDSDKKDDDDLALKGSDKKDDSDKKDSAAAAMSSLFVASLVLLL